MGIFTKDIQTLEDLFAHQLKDIYYAEHRITKALPKMIAKATSPALKQGFETHLAETETQIQRLDRVFTMLGLKTLLALQSISAAPSPADETRW